MKRYHESEKKLVLAICLLLILSFIIAYFVNLNTFNNRERNITDNNYSQYIVLDKRLSTNGTYTVTLKANVNIKNLDVQVKYIFYHSEQNIEETVTFSASNINKNKKLEKELNKNRLVYGNIINTQVIRASGDLD